MSDPGLRVLLCTAPQAAAERIARALLEAKLIGCCNIVPGLRSLYWWDGAIQDDAEVLLMMECPSEHARAAVTRLAEVHPYEVPKIVVLEPADINGPYLAWLRAATGLANST